jgi:hypothetical protein
MTEVETARALYDRIRQDSRCRQHPGGMAPYRVVNFIARMMQRDPFAVLNAIGVERVANDDADLSNPDTR